MMFTEGAPPMRFWLLEVGVVGVRASEVLWLSGRDEGARPAEVETRTQSQQCHGGFSKCSGCY